MILDHKPEAKTSRDWKFLFLITVNLAVFPVPLLFPIFATFRLAQLDPWYYIIEMFGPSAYERSLSLIFTILLIRIFLGMVCAFEFARFASLLLFIMLFFIFTLINCIKQLIRQPYLPRNITLRRYIQLRILMKAGDYFSRQIAVYCVLCTQLITITMWWTVLKCWSTLPSYITLCFLLVALFAPIGVLTVFPGIVAIYKTSKKLVEVKIANYHSFNRYHQNRYYYLKWYSQRVLAFRFGSQLTFNQDTFRDYFEVLIINLTNAILLIQP